MAHPRNIHKFANMGFENGIDDEVFNGVNLNLTKSYRSIIGYILRLWK